MRFRELVETPIDETERRGRQQPGFAAPDLVGAGPTTPGSAGLVISLSRRRDRNV